VNKNLVTILLFSTLYGCGGSSDSPEPPVKTGNTAATFSGDFTANLNSGETSVSGVVNVTDPDAGESALVEQSGVSATLGTFSIGTDGAWTYTLVNTNASFIALGDDDNATDTFTLTSTDGTTQSLAITVQGLNDSAVFGSGDNVDSANMSNNIASISGTLGVTDPDSGQSVIEEQIDVVTVFGTFSIDTTGAWTYLLNTSNAAVSSLADETEHLTEEVTVASIDGSQTTISILIVGMTSTGEVRLTKGAIGSDDSVPEVTCTNTVSSTSALEDAASFAMTAGETLCLASGSYSGLDLTFGGTGTAEAPITIAAEVPGEVFINGEVFVGMTGEYVVLQGFIFKDGTLDSSLLQTRANSSTPCNHCRITENAFIDMDEGMDDSTKWMQIYGSDNRIDHNWFSGKTTRGALLVIERGDAPGTEDRTLIDHNYFGDRPPIDGKAYAASSDNEYEGIRVGSSNTHTTDSFAIIEHNYFEGIDAEAEVISTKAGGVTVRHNTIRNSRGSIVSRHGEGTTISNNFVFGDDNPFSGGIRVVDANHTITNNYIQGARYKNTNFYGGILVSNSDGSTSNGYQDVENVLVANNTVVDSVNSLNFDAGSRSSAPDSVYFVNNLVADAIGPVLVNSENLPTNAVFSGNYVYGQSFADEDSVNSIEGFSFVNPMLTQDSVGVSRPSVDSDLLADTAPSIGNFSLPIFDMDGQTRSQSTLSGADDTSSEQLQLTELRGVLSASLVGPLSYIPPSTNPHVGLVTLTNHDFDTGDFNGWTNNGASLTTDSAEVFSRGVSVKIDNINSNIAQTATVSADTNYTASAFIQGPGKLSVTVDGQTYAAEQSSSSYRFTSVSFNSGSATNAQITASMDDSVLNSVAIANPNFDDDQDGWVVNEGSGIGQVQDSDNSSDSTEGSIKFKYNDEDSGTPYDPYIAQTVTVTENTEYTLTMYVLLKGSDEQDATVLFGAHAGQAIVDGVFETGNVIASKNSAYASLIDDGAEDSFKPDTVTFNSGSHTQITIFAQYQSSLGDDIRIDQFSLTSEGTPDGDSEALFDSFRLVSHASLNE
jgi:poly(beta-D-mannuronate) lyase